MDPSDISQILILIILIMCSAFFSCAETSLTAVNKLRIRSLAEKGNKKAQTVGKLIENPGKMLSTILVGNNIVNLTTSSLATTFAIRLARNAGLDGSTSLAVGIATGIVTILILLFGEITPKSIAALNPEKAALFFAEPIFFLTQLLTPVIFIINVLSRGILFLLRVDLNQRNSAITESELRTIVDFSHEEGVIESEERRMITNVVDFGDSLAKDVMVPQIDTEFAEINYTYAQLVDAFEKEKYSRLPVYEDSKDNIVGIINLKDVFFYKGEKENFDIRNIMREPYFTYEFQKVSDLMVDLRKTCSSVAIVLDEYGSTAGLITLEDLLEEIVGEIRDEYDTDEVDSIQLIGENEYLVQGTARLDEINEQIGCHLESDDYDSIAGHIINLLEHLPKVGESVEENNILYTVKQLDKNRIDKIHIKLLSVPQAKEV